MLLCPECTSPNLHFDPNDQALCYAQNQFFPRACRVVCEHFPEGIPLTSALKKQRRAWQLSERKGMEKAAVETTTRNFVRRIIDKFPDATTESLSKLSDDLPKYQMGQTVQQWWASWMQDGVTAPVQTNTSDRPKWYSAFVNGIVGRRDMKYAGINYTNVWVYHAH